ncbi:MAG TPA: molybdopterin synthase catalytic subunit MoaE [Ferrovibrio sp.]|jgi:molybdopterin synthase catalytic subunit|uniref:molybdopterin synthase catalytic subunit MoaE n=1 Tax=Ferrovibrio sp. TaxID=1917215 RepID=UPI002B4AB28F|nr:molybdopterin synthase catalytic subunit MoaE [Ferrovibrio sp.]HLT76040.1 molybdopterin synthase catalytic subunit MoaE [Ferrovibrio sp.]
MTVRVQREDFDTAAELEGLTRGNRKIGAVVTFTGLVRDFAEDGQIRKMTLEHYPGMTEKQLAAIVQQAEQRWPLDGCLVIHRYGPLEPGDRIVLVIVASAHRQAAFEACAFLVDWLKTRAPFWKLEEREQGHRWVEAKSSDDAAAARWHR